VAEDPEIAAIDAIYDALDEGRSEEALALGRRALAALTDDDPVLRYLCGVALADLDRPAEAVTELARAVELDPQDPEFQAELALALYHCCRFDDAWAAARRARRLPGAPPEADHVAALLLERRGELDQAELAFATAARRDPERFPLPRRVAPDEFAREIERARQRLPAEFRAHLDRLPLIVEDLPAEPLLTAERPPLDPELLGLFVGVPLDRIECFGPGGEPTARIYLFKRNLERHAPAPGELAEQVAVTLYHELGHYLGLDEEDLDRLGFA